jgi:hypothetical protein
MKAFVDQGTVAGVVTLVARHGVIAQPGRCWVSGLGNEETDEDRFNLSDHVDDEASRRSCHHDAGGRGKVAVSDPVEKHLPEFRGLWLNTSKPGEKGTPASSPTACDYAS